MPECRSVQRGGQITVGGRHIANWLIGQVRNENQNEEDIMAYARELGADESAFREAYRQVPVMSQEQFEKVAHVLFTVANQLSYPKTCRRRWG